MTRSTVPGIAVPATMPIPMTWPGACRWCSNSPVGAPIVPRSRPPRPPTATNWPFRTNTTTNPSACVSNPPSSWSPYNACTIVELSSKTTQLNGSNSSNAPWVEDDNTYDDYNPNSGGLNTNGYHNLTQQVVKGSNLPTSLYPLTKKWTYTTNASAPGGSWTYYTVDTVTHSEVDDATGHAWQCQSTSYDQGSSNPTPDAGWPTTVQTYSSGNCASQSSPLTTSYSDYDIYGNVVATVDPDGAALPDRKS